MSELEHHFHVQASLALQLLKELPTEADEENHVEADAILVDFVRQLGFTEIAEAYENIGKWYAWKGLLSLEIARLIAVKARLAEW